MESIVELVQSSPDLAGNAKPAVLQALKHIDSSVRQSAVKAIRNNSFNFYGGAHSITMVGILPPLPLAS